MDKIVHDEVKIYECLFKQSLFNYKTISVNTYVLIDNYFCYLLGKNRKSDHSI